MVLAASIILFQTGWLHRSEVVTIELYQRIGSPIMRYLVTCRFNPTCSNYALYVLKEEGFWKGNLLIGYRLLRCSPVGLLFEL